GHGGADHGVRGADGTSEKTVTLILARMLANELEDSYRVILTRTDDEGLDIHLRTAAANHLRADLFVSIHAGGKAAPHTGGAALFYFERKSATASADDASPSLPSSDQPSQTLWRKVQHPHQSASRFLARLVGYRLAEIAEAAESRIYGAPIAVLQGADMPAILIEISGPMHPVQEKKLQDTSILSDFTKGIAQGISDFFSKKRK
ncbi:MAG: hypothetical protein B6245_16425, partial [Desulfobacteraceae bacterium 4572_88]